MTHNHKWKIIEEIITFFGYHKLYMMCETCGDVQTKKL